MSVLIGADVPEIHWALEQRFGRRKQPYAIRALLGWILCSPVDQDESSVINIRHTEAEVNSLTKQLDFLYKNEFYKGNYLRSTFSTNDQVATINDRWARLALYSKQQSFVYRGDDNQDWVRSFRSLIWIQFPVLQITWTKSGPKCSIEDDRTELLIFRK